MPTVEFPLAPRGSPALAFLVAGLTAAFLYFRLDGSAQGLVYNAYGVSTVVVIVWAVKHYRPQHSQPWLLLVAGLALWSSGDFIYFAYENALGVLAPFPSWADASYLAGFLVIAVAIISMIRGRTPDGDRAALLDAAIVITATLVLTWPLLLAPYARDSTLSIWERAVATAYPLVDVLLLALVTRLLLAPGPRSASFLLICLAIVAHLIADVSYTRLLLAGNYQTGNPIDAVWLVMNAAFGAAALHPSMRELAEPSGTVAALPSWRRWLLLAGSALFASITVVVQLVRGEPVDAAVVLPAAILFVFLGYLRLQGQDQAMREAAVVGVVSFGALLLSVWFDVFERLYSLFHRPAIETWQLDEVLMVVPIVATAVGLFAWRRWQDARSELRERRKVEAALVHAKVAAEDANRLKTAFLSTMSHELRTPMNAVVGYAHLLLDGYEGDLSERQEADVRHIATAADRLLALLDAVLDLSKIEAGQMDIDREAVALEPILEEVRLMLIPQATAKGIDLAVDVPNDLPDALADPHRTRQILTNLIGNAVKFTDIVSVRVVARGVADGIDIVVSDTGIGIAPEAIGHIFDAFRQADGSTTRRFGGTGLGLTISRRLARLQEGDITVQSEPGCGSTFVLRLCSLCTKPTAVSTTSAPAGPIQLSGEPTGTHG